MSYYSNFLCWFYSNKNTNLVGVARNAPFNSIKDCNSNMIIVKQCDLDNAISKLRPTKTQKIVIFDPMNYMIEELHQVFRKKGWIL